MITTFSIEYEMKKEFNKLAFKYNQLIDKNKLLQSNYNTLLEENTKLINQNLLHNLYSLDLCSPEQSNENSSHMHLSDTKNDEDIFLSDNSKNHIKKMAVNVYPSYKKTPILDTKVVENISLYNTPKHNNYDLQLFNSVSIQTDNIDYNKNIPVLENIIKTTPIIYPKIQFIHKKYKIYSNNKKIHKLSNFTKFIKMNFI